MTDSPSPTGQDDRPEEHPDTQETEWFRPTAPPERPVERDPEQAIADAPEYTVVLPVDETPGRSRTRAMIDGAQTAIRNWPSLIILAALGVAAMIVPTMTDIATTDDWGYTRSVEILLDEGRLTIFPVVAATAVGQVLWGALFGLVFGMSLGMMRVSTVVMVALGAVALYAILRMLGVSKSRSALGMGVWVFNPLTFSLAFSFMTDPHFASMMLVSLAFYVKGLRPDRERVIAIVVGSFLAGLAFLIRQQGALIPFAVGLYLLFGGRLRFDRASLRRMLEIALLPALMFVGYYVWLRFFNDVPDVQQDFFAEIREEGWSGTWLLIRRVPLYVVFYAGILLVPILVAIFPRRREGATPSLVTSPIGFYAFLTWAAVVTGGLYFAGKRGQEMPFAPQFVGPGGFGPPDVLGSQERIWDRGTEIPTALTIVAAVGAIVIGLVICRRLVSESSPERSGFWLVMMVGFWQLVGILPPSYHYLNRGVTLDRYLLPAIAIVIIAVLWALRDVQLMQPIGWIALAAVAVFSVSASRDYLVFMDAVWGMARYANESGVENDRLDAGSGWDGYHLYTTMLEEDITKAKSPPGSPWWVYFYAKPTDSSYIVATEPDVRRGYAVVEQREYDQWLKDEPAYVYLLRQWHLPFPVESDNTGSQWPSGFSRSMPLYSPTTTGAGSSGEPTPAAGPEPFRPR